MTTSRASESSSYTDQFSFWSTQALVGIAFRITPAWERANWVATSPGSDQYDDEELRFLVVEQLEDYGISIHDVNQMKS